MVIKEINKIMNGEVASEIKNKLDGFDWGGVASPMRLMRQASKPLKSILPNVS